MPLHDGSELTAAPQDPRSRGCNMQLFNYAEAGDVLDTTLLRDGRDRGGVMQGQWQRFLKHHEANLAAHSLYGAGGRKGSLRTSQTFVDRRLFTVWIGMNDMCAPEADEDFDG